MQILILFFIAIPLLTIISFWVTNNRKLIGIFNSIGAGLLLITSLFVVNQVINYKSLSSELFDNMFYIDSLSALILLVTTFVVFLVSMYSIGYMNEEFKRNVIKLLKVKIYYSLLHAFILTMIMTLITQNMGIMWISIEATTLSSAFLVGFYNNRRAIEAAWKYIIICSVGIAFALLGIILLYYSSDNSMGHAPTGLNWNYLFANAGFLQSNVLKISFIFIIIGFGTKVGLAPMHTWLPDAHSQAPSPISALLSGVLLNTAMYGIIRVMTIVNKNLGSSIYTGRLLITLGLLSIGTAAFFILVQRDFKRLLAYSSIEHMGIIALGIGIFTPLSIFGALFHLLNHAVTKSMLFLASGNIFLRYETKNINKIKGVIRNMPVTGTVFLLGMFAIIGMPPFSIFSSELNIIIASFKEGRYIIAGIILVFLTMIFAGFITRLSGMLYGETLNSKHGTGEINKISYIVILILLSISAVTGIYMPHPIKQLIDSCIDIISL